LDRLATTALVSMGLLAGIGATVQLGLNMLLARKLGHPNLSALVSFAIGALTLLVICLAMRLPIPALETVRTVPWWYFAGGVAGALFVATSIVLAPRLGAATTFGIIIAGQVAATLVLDHFGWLGFNLHPVTTARVIGAILLVLGVALVLKY
jgi:transporter family-2 protein